MPWGTKQPTKRGLGVAAVCARAVEAGIIASRSGSARVAPAPRRTVRRERCFFVMNIGAPGSFEGVTGSAPGGSPAARPKPCPTKPALAGRLFDGCLHVGLEWGTLDNAHDDGRES